MDHEANRLINTTVDAFGKPISAFLTEAPSWFRSKKELKVEVTDTPKSSLEKDKEVVKNMVLEGKTKEETQEHLSQNSSRMQSFETQEQKDLYLETVLQGAEQDYSLSFAKEKGIDLSPDLGKVSPQPAQEM